MIGRFLELSVHAPDVLASVRFYERLGFRQLQVGETWSHAYGVMSDGRCVLGLHAYEFDSPAVTFVLRDLARKLPHLEQQGLRFAFAKTGDDQFNEAGFITPAGQMVALLEARTYSPADFADYDVSQLGRMLALALPAGDVAGERDFWSALGLRAGDEHADPWQHVMLSGEDISLAVHQRPHLRETALHFACPDMSTLLQTLDDAEHPWEPVELPGAPRSIRMRGPEGLACLVQPA